MPVYLFRMRHDQEGIEPAHVTLPDAHAAWAQAITACGEMLRDLDGELVPRVPWEMEVTDEAGSPIFVFRFCAENVKSRRR